MRKLRKIHDEQEARALLAEVKAAGGDLTAWARAHGVDGRSLHAWYRNLTRRGGESRSTRRRRVSDPALRLVEIVARPSMDGRYVLKVANVEVAVDDNFQEETLRRLLAVLRSC